MNKHPTEFSDEELKGAIDSREAEAKRILEDEGKLKQLLGKAKKIISTYRSENIISETPVSALVIAPIVLPVSARVASINPSTDLCVSI